MKRAEPQSLVGRHVRGADGKIYRVSQYGMTPKPWGRTNGSDLVEIPRPFVVLSEREGIEALEAQDGGR